MGRRKVGPARDLAAHMVEVILEDRPIPAGTPVVVLVNGAGGTTLMELLIVYREVAAVLEERGISPVSPLVGSFVTTQEMGGVSISLFTPSAEMLDWWREPSATPFFPAVPGAS